MEQLINAALSPINLPFSMLLLFTLIYWVTVILGVVDLDFLNVDVDVQADVDVDMDVDVEAGSQISSTAGVSAKFLKFMNLGYVPLMVVFSFMSISLWVCSILGNYYLNTPPAFLVSSALILVNISVSLIITKIVTTPLKSLFQTIGESSAILSVLGTIGTIKVPSDGKSLGQAEVTIDDSTLLVNVRPHDGASLEKGTAVLIISESSDNKYYFVEEYNE